MGMLPGQRLVAAENRNLSRVRSPDARGCPSVCPTEPQHCRKRHSTATGTLGGDIRTRPFHACRALHRAGPFDLRSGSSRRRQILHFGLTPGQLLLAGAPLARADAGPRAKDRVRGSFPLGQTVWLDVNCRRVSHARETSRRRCRQAAGLFAPMRSRHRSRAPGGGILRRRGCFPSERRSLGDARDSQPIREVDGWVCDVKVIKIDSQFMRRELLPRSPQAFH